MEVGSDDVKEVSPRLQSVEALSGTTGCIARHHLAIASVAMMSVTVVAGSLYLSGAGLPRGPLLSVRSPTLLANSLRFAAIGDWGRHGGEGQDYTAQTMGRLLGEVNGAFVVSVGDNHYDNGIDTDVNDPSFRSSWTNVYTHEALKDKHWYAIAGNHDYRGNLTAQSAYAAKDPRWHFGLNYTMQWRLPGAAASDATACVRAVMFDTTPMLSYYRTGKEDTHQMASNIARAATPDESFAWIEAQLAAAEGACRAVITVGHHPVFTAGAHGNTPELVARLLPLLTRYNVDAYLCGHDHLLNHLVGPNGTDFVLTGAGSRVRESGVASPETTFMWERSGFTLHSVNLTHVSHSYVDGATGDTVYELQRALKPKRASSGSGSNAGTTNINGGGKAATGR